MRFDTHVTSVALNRLGGRETAAIIARLVGNKELPSDVMAEIVERTDGIPLFVEEMTKAVLEAESEAKPGPPLLRFRYLPCGPRSLHASLMARLDRLGPAKEVAQIGAAIGREFSHALLAAVVTSRRRNWDQHSTVLWRLGCYSGRACRHMRPTCSSMPWCKTRLMARCCASPDARFTPASPKLWSANSRRLPRASRSYWPVIAPKRA